MKRVQPESPTPVPAKRTKNAATGPTPAGPYTQSPSYYFTQVTFLVRVFLFLFRVWSKLDLSKYVFQVEDTLFRVPRHPFVRESAVFRAMFTLPVPKDTTPDGVNDDQPLRLDGVAKKDFEHLLSMMFPECVIIMSLRIRIQSRPVGVRGLERTSPSSDFSPSLNCSPCSNCRRCGKWMLWQTLSSEECPLQVQNVKNGWRF